jgi:hypothetical protein
MPRFISLYNPREISGISNLLTHLSPKDDRQLLISSLLLLAISINCLEEGFCGFPGPSVLESGAFLKG